MDYLWTPWRYRYIADASKDEGCIFCAAVDMKNDATALIVLRGQKNFVILNRFPYTTGHVTFVENFGLYWHFVDIVWIFLFPLLYLISRY